MRTISLDELRADPARVELAVGVHRMVVLIDEPSVVASSEADPSNACLERRNGILVYTGQLLDDPDRVLEEMRRERENWFLRGCSDEGPSCSKMTDSPGVCS